MGDEGRFGLDGRDGELGSPPPGGSITISIVSVMLSVPFVAVKLISSIVLFVTVPVWKYRSPSSIVTDCKCASDGSTFSAVIVHSSGKFRNLLTFRTTCRSVSAPKMLLCSTYCVGREPQVALGITKPCFSNWYLFL